TGAEEEEVVFPDRRLERMAVLLSPAGQEPVDADRVDDGARKDMRADLRALFQHDDGKLRIDLLQPDRGGEARRPRADDDHVEFHAFALDFIHPENLLAVRLPAEPNSCRRSITHISRAWNREGEAG